MKKNIFMILVLPLMISFVALSGYANGKVEAVLTHDSGTHSIIHYYDSKDNAYNSVKVRLQNIISDKRYNGDELDVAELPSLEVLEQDGWYEGTGDFSNIKSFFDPKAAAVHQLNLELNEILLTHIIKGAEIENPVITEYQID
ncbi:MAG: hypothetical protein MJB14_19820 [Spirochaetes bacterium]|nr:hypothetical protein [Spirochaetota bacterium]